MPTVARTLDAVVGNNNGIVLSVDSYNTVGIEIAGLSGSNGTVNFEGSVSGFNWVPVNATPAAGTTPATSAITSGVWVAEVAGFRYFRTRLSGYSGSTPITVTSFGSNAIYLPSITGGGGGGGVAATEYAENAVLPADPLAPLRTLRRRDTLIDEGVTDGRPVVQNGTGKGESYIKDADAFAKLEAIRVLLLGPLSVGTHAVTGTVTANISSPGTLATEAKLEAVRVLLANPLTVIQEAIRGTPVTASTAVGTLHTDINAHIVDWIAGEAPEAGQNEWGFITSLSVHNANGTTGFRLHLYDGNPDVGVLGTNFFWRGGITVGPFGVVANFPDGLIRIGISRSLYVRASVAVTTGWSVDARGFENVATPE